MQNWNSADGDGDYSVGRDGDGVTALNAERLSMKVDGWLKFEKRNCGRLLYGMANDWESSPND